MNKQKIIHQLGYILLYKPDHPFCDNHGYVFEHRLVMEQKIGKYLNRKTEKIHHVDGNVKNNNIENLQILTHKEHKRIHNGWWLNNGKWFKVCRTCNQELEVNGKNFTKRNGQAKGYLSECKKCIVKKVKKWRHRNDL